ncbi:DUF3231 family protein [Paenibacillus aceris]|uniref:Uncharacterized protein n=1 Tax=Paenibacillus aceris TaxID=869555 RepID=A0ABS4I730_9BACL|nr:DUF3231 family protein [Paenibacillus aceris]MBP1966216.1 hypothetical protein [Paenibacillus aceris]NHW33368.1 DUF3231 family protein [Paenibacillus aceris]
MLKIKIFAGCFALGFSQNHVDKVAQLFANEKYPVPQGFTDKDVNLTAPRLYSDKLILYYMLNMAKLGLFAYSTGLTFSERADIIELISTCLMESKELHNNAKMMAQKKGVYIHCPIIPTPSSVEFVHKQSFLGGLFSEKRPLIANEIANLTYNVERNVLGKSLIISFSQVAKIEAVRKYFVRGREIAQNKLMFLVCC